MMNEIVTNWTDIVATIIKSIFYIISIKSHFIMVIAMSKRL